MVGYYQTLIAMVIEAERVLANLYCKVVKQAKDPFEGMYDMPY